MPVQLFKKNFLNLYRLAPWKIFVARVSVLVDRCAQSIKAEHGVCLRGWSLIKGKEVG